MIPEFTKTNTDASIITNFFNVDTNFENLQKYLDYIDKNIINIIGSSVINEIKESVIEKISEMKHIIEYDCSIAVGNPIIINGFKYTKTDDTTLRIEREGYSNWDTKPLIIQVYEKDSKTVIYPIITKYDGYFDIKFSSKIIANGVIIIL